MHGPFLGEFMGTLVLILLGDGVVANVLLKQSKGENSGWIVITTAWGMAVVAGIFTAVAFGSPGAHINPAITLTVALLTGNWSNVALFWAAQFLGAFAGATLVWMTYLPHWRVTPNAGAKLAIFCTAPAIRNLPANLLTEIIAHMLDRGGLQFWQQGRVLHRSASRIRTVALGSAGLGNRTESRRADRICHEPGSRLWPARCARYSAHQRQRQFGLGICARADRWSVDRRRYRRGNYQDSTVIDGATGVWRRGFARLSGA